MALALVAASAVLCPHARADGITPAQVRAAQKGAAVRLAATERSVRPGRYPAYSTDAGWRTASPLGWASGYAPGLLWLEYQRTGLPWWRLHAVSRQEAIGSLLLTPDTLNLGSLFYPTFARGYKLTGSEDMRRAAMYGAVCMAARYDPTVGAMRSRRASDYNGDFNLIIDSIMKVSLLYWGVENGGPAEWGEIARRHALTMARDFVRPDGSTYHLVNYDEATGAVKERTTSAGFAPESTWARGQAWAIYGFTTAYEKSHDPVLLATARRVADRYLAALPSDLVPFWDFDDPSIPASPRDTSAAGIAASGLVELALIDPDPASRLKYSDAAHDILAALWTPTYASLGANPAVLLHASWSYRTQLYDVGAAYGDYFFLEALLRLRMLDPGVSPLTVRRVRASAGDGRLATDGLLETVWTTKGAQHLDLRVPSFQRVSGVSVALSKGDRRAAPLRILVSADGSHWRVATQTMSSGETTRFELYDFSRRARWIRVEFSGTSLGRGNTVAEVRVY